MIRIRETDIRHQETAFFLSSERFFILQTLEDSLRITTFLLTGYLFSDRYLSRARTRDKHAFLLL